MSDPLSRFTYDYDTVELRKTLAIHADCFEWMSRLPSESIHSIVTDPPYGIKEYDLDQLEKRDNGTGGIWRIPPSFDGNERSPLPRFTALNDKDLERISEFFTKWSELAVRTLKPGGHVIMACNSIIAPIVYNALIEGGLEFRGQIIRSEYRTLRGGDRPKGAEDKFRNTSTMPRACYEPWALVRKPLGDLRVRDCLRKHSTGALRRKPDGSPFEDVIPSGKTPKAEREIGGHEALKPQDFLRKVVYASLPLGEGVVVDPFMGSGSTLAASEAVEYHAIGVERLPNYFEEAEDTIPRLAKSDVEGQLALM